MVGWPHRQPSPAAVHPRPTRPRPLPGHEQGPGDGLEGFLLGWNAEQEFCDSADDHLAAADEIADEQPENTAIASARTSTPVDQQLLAGRDVERVAENLFGGERGYRLFFARP